MERSPRLWWWRWQYHGSGKKVLCLDGANDACDNRCSELEANAVGQCDRRSGAQDGDSLRAAEASGKGVFLYINNPAMM